MIPFHTRRCFALLVVCDTAIALTALAADPRYIPPAKDAPPTKNTAPSKADVDRKIAVSKRKIEQGKREIQAAQQRLSQQVHADLALANGSGQSSVPKFDPEAAPPPDECLKAFMAAARNAGSIDQ